MAPRFVLDRHVPLATLLLMAAVWLVATIVKVNICLRIGMEACR